MTWKAPEKIHLVPDEWHLERVGVLPDGRLIYQETQVGHDPQASTWRDYVVSYVFDPDGHLVEDLVTLVGVQGEYSEADLDAATKAHSARFGQFDIRDIWVRPFAIQRHGLEFGLVPVNFAEGGPLARRSNARQYVELLCPVGRWRV